LKRVWLLVGAAVLAAWLQWQGQAPVVKPVAAVTAVTAEDRYVIEGAHWTRFDESGQLAFTADVGRAVYRIDESIDLTNIHVQGIGVWQLSAPTGHAEAGSKALVLKDPVTGSGRWPDTGEVAKLSAESVVVDYGQRTVRSRFLLSLSGASRSLSSVGFSAPFDGQTLQLSKNVKITYAFP
jgi:LPS export ABC transporter protein LptC